MTESDLLHAKTAGPKLKTAMARNAATSVPQLMRVAEAHDRQLNVETNPERAMVLLRRMDKVLDAASRAEAFALSMGFVVSW